MYDFGHAENMFELYHAKKGDPDHADKIEETLSLMDFQSEGSIVECSTGYYLAGLIPVPARSQRLRLSPPLYCVRVSVPASRDCGESNIPAGAIFLHG